MRTHRICASALRLGAGKDCGYLCAPTNVCRCPVGILARGLYQIVQVNRQPRLSCLVGRADKFRIAGIVDRRDCGRSICSNVFSKIQRVIERLICRGARASGVPVVKTYFAEITRGNRLSRVDTKSAIRPLEQLRKNHTTIVEMKIEFLNWDQGNRLFGLRFKF